ncbi:MAG TPA: hydroxymethylglutaryl-CoA lyase [Thermoanaerobaculia bacterium]|nr:hydroxymethylglutaryl-CoA lyase [Thermoanaerobaculia bacterium]
MTEELPYSITRPRVPQNATIYEVGPRDGLQNEKENVPTAVKIAFIEMLADAGLTAIEVTSFVRPDAVPQLADASEVVRGVRRRSGLRLPVLVPNMKGFEAARAVGVREVAVFTAASETFNRRNINCGIEESIERFRPVVAAAAEEKIRVRGYISTAFGCPFEGRIEPESVREVVHMLLDLGIEEISIGDTIGVATPNQVYDVVETLYASGVTRDVLALHFHDTRGTALANVCAGLDCGVTIFDSSAGGLGGCPYAPGATGNLATEDLVYLLDGLGVSTGVSLPGVVEASLYLARETGGHPSSRYLAARLGESEAAARA